jgi:hypothetical protein
MANACENSTIAVREGKLTAVMAFNWVLGKAVIPQGRKFDEVLGEAGVLPVYFDVSAG